MSSSSSSFDDIPDEFEGIDFDKIPALCTTPRSSSSDFGSPYSCDDDWNPAFLAELDALEKQEMGKLAHQKATSDVQTSRFFPTGTSFSYRSPCQGESKNQLSFETRTRKRVSSLPSPSKKKGKMKDDGVAQVLEGFQDEITCPICFDIFVAAHLGNPCGHTFCGECGWGWISQNKKAPTCAVCRSKLSKASPMIPNLAVENTVEKHIQALQSNGNKEWQPGGKKITEWTARKQSWKVVSVKRSQALKRGATNRGRRLAYVDAEWAAYSDGSDGEDDWVGIMDATVRMTRSTTRRGG